MRPLGATIEQVLTRPVQELGRWARLLRFQIELWRFCARRLHENNVTAMSAALSFRTVFALIPVLVLALLVLKSVGALENSKRSLRHFLEASGFGQITVVQAEPGATPDATAAATQPSAVNLADQLERIVADVESKLTFERIGPVGGALLIWTALTLITTIERALNRIFGAPRSRSLARRVLLYWSAMTLAPLGLVAAQYVGQNAVRTFEQTAGWPWVLALAGWIGPLLASVAILAAVYKLLPNTHVSLRSAIGGAAVAVPAWLLAKWGFSLYVRHFVMTGNLYGLLGVLPLFLMWLNLSWLIFLFGAQLAHTAAHLSQMRWAEAVDRRLLGLTDLLAVATAVARRFIHGDGPVALHRLASEVALPEEAVGRLLEKLRAGGVVIAVGNEDAPSFAPARPPEQIRLAELVRLIEDCQAPAATTDDDEGAPVRSAAAGAVQRMTAAVADTTLADLATASPSGPPPAGAKGGGRSGG